MMILSGDDIARYREFNADTPADQPRIVIDPWNPKNLGANSYDVTLADELQVYSATVLDMRKSNHTKRIKIGEAGFLLLPGQLYLGCTQEWTETYNLVPMLEGRSSIGRLGLAVHVSAGFGDRNFSGRWTLELTTVHPLRVYAGVKIAQIFYHHITPGSKIYAGKYAGDKGAMPSKLFIEFEDQSKP